MPVTEQKLVQLPVFQLEEVFTPVETEEIITQDLEMQKLPIPAVSPDRATINIIPLIYLTGFVISLILALVAVISVVRIIVTARSTMYRQQRILVSSLPITSFTFAKWIVISEMDYERFAAEIITHEAIHRRKGHFWDLCLINLLTIVHWFNPLSWLLRRELIALHEYEADRSTLMQGVDATQYKLLLIEKAVGTSRYAAANSFIHGKIKKRIIMMNKQNSKQWARWKALLFILMTALLLQAFAQSDIERKPEQNSTLNSTGIYQENADWTKERFFEEVRKCLPAGASRELNYLNSYLLAVDHLCMPGPHGLKYGYTIMMNRHGDMAVNPNATITMEELSAGLNKLIESDEKKNIVRSMSLEISVDAPADLVQQMMNVVGETYMAKRNEKAQKKYQTDYTSLNEIQQSEIDKLVPILVHYETKELTRYFDGDKKRFSSVIFDAPSVSRNQLSKKITDEAWEKAEKELAILHNQEIPYNGKMTKIKDIFDLLRRDTKGTVKLCIRYKVNNYTGELETSMSLTAPAIDPKNPEYYYVFNEKWVYSLSMDIDIVKSIDTYTPEQAVKRYGKKAKNGAIAVTWTREAPFTRLTGR